MSWLERERAHVVDAMRAHLSQQEAEELASRARPAIEISAQRSFGLPLGASHFGGHAMLASGTAWPCFDEVPLSLLAVIDLAATATLDEADLLPKHGFLNFFYDSCEDSFVTGLESHEADGWRVIWTDRDTVVDVPPPAEARRYPHRAMRGAPVLTLPDPEELYEHPIPDRFSDACCVLDPDTPYALTRHLIGGWPDLVQAPFGRQCALVSRGCAYDADKTDPSVAEVTADAPNWRLLLQLDTDDDLEFDWGDTGRLYYAAREQDVLRGDFSGVWLDMQST